MSPTKDPVVEEMLKEYLLAEKATRERGYTLEGLYRIVRDVVDHMTAHEKADAILHAEAKREVAELDMRQKSSEVTLSQHARWIEALNVDVHALKRNREPPASKALSIPPPRDELPSLLDVDENDSPAQVRKKHEARESIEKRDRAILEWAAEEKAAVARRNKTLTHLAVILGIIISIGTISMGIWYVFQKAVAAAEGSKPTSTSIAPVTSH